MTPPSVTREEAEPAVIRLVQDIGRLPSYDLMGAMVCHWSDLAALLNRYLEGDYPVRAAPDRLAALDVETLRRAIEEYEGPPDLSLPIHPSTRGVLHDRITAVVGAIANRYAALEGVKP